MSALNSHIEQEHPDYAESVAMWRRYRDLYVGGEQFQQRAAEYIVRRNKEPMEVYGERLRRVFYENYLGSIVDWYAATLVRREPVTEFSGDDEPGKSFYSRFVQDSDLRGTSLTQFYKQQVTDALVCGKSYIGVDFPAASTKPATRAEEDAAGISRAYLRAYRAEEVINWDRNRLGEFEWVVVKTSCLQQEAARSMGWKRQTRWIHYDRTRFEIYEKREDGKGIELVQEGLHGFAGINQVPIFELRVSEGLWLANKVASLQLEHFNKSNALAWALTMGLFAQPVIYSERPFQQIIGESYYIQLDPGDKFGWTEPEGKVFQIAADNLARLRDEIYRVSYLMQQAGDTSGGNQSGLSKQWDFAVTQEILRAYGDMVKDSMRNVLSAVIAARQDRLNVDVVGLDEFDITDFSTEAADAQALLALGIDSPTLKKQMFKRVALKYLSDTRQDIKMRIIDEIDRAA